MPTKCVITPYDYFILLKKNELNEEELKDLIEFEKHMSEEMKYEDYLLPFNKRVIFDYRHGIIELEMQEENGIELAPSEKEAINKYHKFEETVRRINNENIKLVKKLKNDSSLGYANAFIVILSVLAVGIIAGTILFFTLQP